MNILQLGEALGGSVDAMMRAAGYTDTKTFFKAVEDGKIMANDVLPKFGQELQKLAKEGGALDAVMGKTQANFSRFLNAVTEAKLTIFEGGMDKGLNYLFAQLSDLLVEMQPVTEAIGQAFRGAVVAATSALKVLLVPIRIVVRIFKSFGDVLKELGVQDGTGLIWRLVGAGGVLALMATKFSFVTKAVVGLNAALLTTLARLAPIIAAYATIEDMFLYMKYGDNANTVTGTVAKGLKQIPDMGVGGFFENALAGYTRNSPLAWTGLLPEYNVSVGVKEGEFAKVLDVQVEKGRQAKAAVSQTENTQ